MITIHTNTHCETYKQTNEVSKNPNKQKVNNTRQRGGHKPKTQAAHGMADTPVAVHCLTSSDNAAQCPDCRRYMSNVSEQQQTMFPDATTCNYTQLSAAQLISLLRQRYNSEAGICVWHHSIQKCTLYSVQQQTLKAIMASAMCLIIQFTVLYSIAHCPECTLNNNAQSATPE